MITGGVETENPVWSAPLAGISVPALRRYHRRMGAGLAHTEMVSAAGLVFGSKQTYEMLEVLPDEGPVVLQMFGGCADQMAHGAEIALEKSQLFKKHAFCALQINMACPMPKVTRRMAGAELLNYPCLAGRMVRELIRFGLPVWVKIRLCTDFDDTADFCARMLDAGASHIALHGRTRAQRYDGTADVEAVCRIARMYPGRVAGSGDVFTPKAAQRYLEGGCAAVLVARGLVRDPTLVSRILEEMGVSEVCHKSQMEALLELGDELVAMSGERLAMTIAKRMCAGLFRNTPRAAALRNAAMQTRTWEELRSQVSGWWHEIV